MVLETQELHLWLFARQDARVAGGLKEYHDARFASQEPLLFTDVTSGDTGPSSTQTGVEHNQPKLFQYQVKANNSPETSKVT